MKQARWKLRSGDWEITPHHITDQVMIGGHRRVELMHFGVVYASSGASPAQALKVALSDKMSTVDIPKQITKTIWGSYLAIVVDEEKSCRIFVPDPMRSVHLYYRQLYSGNLDLDIDLVQMVAGRQPIWNIGYLVHFAETRCEIEGHTPFLDVASVPLGYCLQVNADGTVEMMRSWLGPASNVADHSDLADEMLTAFRAMLKDRRDIVLPLSHDTVSAATAVFLKAALPSMDRVHVVEFSTPDLLTPSAENSVEHFAKEIGAQFTSFHVDDALPFANLTPKQLPTSLNERLLFLKKEEVVQAVAAENGCLLDCHGSDILFNALPDGRSVTEAFKAKGGSFAFATAKKLARLRRVKISEIIIEGIIQSARASLLGSAHAGSRGHRGLFPHRADIMPDSARPSRRLKRALFSRAAPGQWANLARAQTLQGSLFGNSVAILNPYFSQPVVEAAMQIKSYDSFTEDFDQVNLRKAASRLLTCNDIWHEPAKASHATLIQALQTKRQHVWELIQQGVLMKSGYLDRNRLLRALKLMEQGHASAARSISLIACVEIFCLAWENAVEPPKKGQQKAGDRRPSFQEPEPRR